MATYFTEVSIVIDGMEECQDYTELAARLVGLAGGNTKVLMTSLTPPMPMVNFMEGILNGKPTLAMDVKLAKIYTDICKYIDFRLARDAGLKTVKPAMKTEIKDTLMMKIMSPSVGMYVPQEIGDLISRVIGFDMWNVNLTTLPLLSRTFHADRPFNIFPEIYLIPICASRILWPLRI